MNFELTFADLLYTAAYSLNIASFLSRKMLFLRLGVLIATLGFLVFSLMLGNVSMIAWNSAFVLVNLYQLVRLIIENRNIELGALLDSIYQMTFKRLSKRDFLYFWELGWDHKVGDELILEHEKRTDSMFFLVDGFLEVRKNSRIVTEVGPNHFVGEMSFLTGKPATADVNAPDGAHLREWNKEKIRALKKLKPDLYQAIVEILGTDLSKKLSRSE